MKGGGRQCTDAGAVRFAGCFRFGLPRSSKPSSSVKGRQVAAADHQHGEGDVKTSPAAPTDSASSKVADKQPAVAQLKGDLSIFRGDSASFTDHRADLCKSAGVIDTFTPAPARALGQLRTATPPPAEASDRSFVTAAVASSTCSSTISDGGSGTQGSGAGGDDDDNEVRSPRLKAIDAFVRNRSSMDVRQDSDPCSLRTSSAGPASPSISLDAWLRSGSGSMPSRPTGRGRSSLSMDNWVRTGSAGSLDLLRSRLGGGSSPGRSSLSADLPQGGGGGARLFANRSTPGGLESIRSSLGGRLAQRDSRDSRCSADVELRRELLSAMPAPLHLFESEPPKQGAAKAAGALLPAGHRYQRLSSLSSGFCTSVDLCLDTETDTPVVIRFIERGPALDETAVRRQLKFHQRAAGHPNIAQLLDVFALPEHLALVMEWANCGDLKAYITSYTQENGTGIPEKDARCVMRQLLTAVRFAHRHGCTTSGVKLGDVLLHVDPVAPSSITVKLLCGWAGGEDGLFSPSNVKLSGGLPNYKAPEALHNENYEARHADAWCCGAIMYMLLAGAFPFLTAREAGRPQMQQLHALVQRIVSGRFLDLARSVTPSCGHLITRLLDPDPDLRITVREALQHPWTAADPAAAGPEVAAGLPNKENSIPAEWDAALRGLTA